jgi:hypothetical protein
VALAPAVAGVVALQLTLACGDATATAPIKTATSTPTPPAPTAVALAISPGDLELSLGTGTTLAAVQVMSDGTRVPVRASWVSFSDMVVTVNGANGYAVAVGPGQARIRADAGGLFAYATLNVLEAKGTGTPEVLVVENFSITEYPSAGHWEYAPQLRLRAASGHILTVLLVKMSIPDFFGAVSWGCGATLNDMPRELNGEVYGDWAFAFFSPGNRASGADATAVITFVDETGATASRTVRGPVVAGGLPTTYVSGNTGACFHGYGGTG